ncbi:MAG: hypothetical protein E7460_04070 [Ruminococcaceae bacterium]|nr:hypothetical protein [Oscillospiraceae bacterium]
MEYFLLPDKSFSAVADQRMNNKTVKRLWNSFTLTKGEICFEKGEEFTFRSGLVLLPTLPQGKEYVLSVSENGIAIVGRDYGGLMHGFMSLLMKIEQNGDGFRIMSVYEESGYAISNRMIHICVFPENDLYFIKKLIRLSALCQYTHVVIEFWGMLRYDCLKELSWPHAFTKAQAKELIDECRELGMEPIPMYNQLGHATGSRLCYGKHVVLDQDPGLQRLFTPDGWAWDINSPEVFSLLKQVRTELYELFGPGEYVHLGCDEAYFITRNGELRKNLALYLGKLTREAQAEGRRPMLWMDMLLERGAFPNCYTVGEKDEVALLRNSMAGSTVFVDWQYECVETPIPSLVSLKNCGRDVIGAPWYNEQNYSAHVQTVRDNAMYGIMLTTWHTLKEHMPSIPGCAKKLGAKFFTWSDYSGLQEETATLLRRVSFEGNSYSNCGWSKQQIDF